MFRVIFVMFELYHGFLQHQYFQKLSVTITLLSRFAVWKPKLIRILYISNTLLCSRIKT